MTLILHTGAQEVSFPALRELETPEATATHVPIPHFRLVDMVRHTLSYYGHQVTDEHHGVTPDGARYFGILKLKSEYGGYEDAVALRNSHDKTFPVGIGFGASVFCCDNLSFYADHVIRRRHTANAKRALPGLVQEVVEPLAERRREQEKLFDRYRAAQLTDERADHAVVQMYRRGVINPGRITDVLEEWEHPSFEDWGGRTAYRLFNAVTFILTGKVVANPSATRSLHAVIDCVCN